MNLVLKAIVRNMDILFIKIMKTTNNIFLITKFIYFNLPAL